MKGQAMTTKKSSTKASHAPTLNAEVALLIANLLAHPMTPTEIYNALGAALAEIENEDAVRKLKPTETPEHIERVLNAQDGMSFRAFGRFERVKRPDGYTAFRLVGFDDAGKD
jgi:hypothetical protein